MWIFIDLISVVVCVFPFSSSSFSTSSTSSSSSFSSSTSYQIQGTNNVSFKLFNIHDLSHFEIFNKNIQRNWSNLH